MGQRQEKATDPAPLFFPCSLVTSVPLSLCPLPLPACCRPPAAPAGSAGPVRQPPHQSALLYFPFPKPCSTPWFSFGHVPSLTASSSLPARAAPVSARRQNGTMRARALSSLPPPPHGSVSAPTQATQARESRPSASFSTRTARTTQSPTHWCGPPLAPQGANPHLLSAGMQLARAVCQNRSQGYRLCGPPVDNQHPRLWFFVSLCPDHWRRH